MNIARHADGLTGSATPLPHHGSVSTPAVVDVPRTALRGWAEPEVSAHTQTPQARTGPVDRDDMRTGEVAGVVPTPPKDRATGSGIPVPCVARPSSLLWHLDGACRCFFGGPAPEFAPSYSAVVAAAQAAARAAVGGQLGLAS